MGVQAIVASSLAKVGRGVPLVFRVLLKGLLLLSMGLTSISAWATYWKQPASAPQDDRVFVVDEAALPFEPLPGTNTNVSWGTHKAAGYRIEVPEAWNGELIMYAHGFRGTGEALTVDSPPFPMRAWMLSQGYAWAASSYSKNYYDVRSGVQSTNDLARLFASVHGKPSRTFITGFSMGGHVTGAAIEQFPNIACREGRRGRTCRRVAEILGKLSGGIQYSGAAPFCGVMGDLELFDYFGDFARGAEASAGVPLTQFPPPANYYAPDGVFPAVLGTLFQGGFAGFPNARTAQGEQHKAFAQLISGGERPGFDSAYAFWAQFLYFGFGASGGDVDGVLSGNSYDNARKVYQLDTNRAVSDEERAFNQAVFRVRADRGVNPKRFLKLQRVPEIHGRLAIPVVSTHTLGDLFVPFSMEQIYAKEVQSKRRSQYLVSRATRALGHCEFSSGELVGALADMIQWANTGQRPGGDDILNAEAMAQPDAGCAFSTDDSQVQSRLAFGACPASAPE